jgi:hypothetical protein
MNYQKIHDAIIERAKTRQLEGYKERHHIIPRCMGGTNNHENLVELTAREHYIVHKLLCAIHPHIDKLHYALWRMMNPQNKNHNRSYNISSREYQNRRKIHQEKIRNIGLLNKGRVVTDKQKEKIRKARKLQVITDETKKKISNALINKKKPPRTEEHRKNLQKSLLGKNKGKPKPKRANEHCHKLSLALKMRPEIICPFCNLIGKSKSNMNRYHFDNCKYK